MTDRIITAQSPCEVEIIKAALDRAEAQALLEEGASQFASFYTMRSRQDAVNAADNRIAVAANTMLAAETLASVKP